MSGALLSCRELLGPWGRPLVPIVDAALGLSGVEALYRRVGGRGEAAQDFCRRMLQELGVAWDCDPLELQRLAEVEGPCLVVANHPLGGREALVLHLVLGACRPDYRILSNSLLGRVPEVRERLILVDPFAGSAAAHGNRAPLREALRWLRGGGLMGVFPAGEISLWRRDEGRVADKDWAAQPFRLAEAAQATLVPLHFGGSSSAWLRAWGRVHPSLKTPWLAQELLRGPARELTLHLGEPVPFRAWPPSLQDLELAAWAREQCYALGRG